MYNIFRSSLHLKSECISFLKSCCGYHSKSKKNIYIELQGELIYGIQPVKMCLRAKRRTIHCLYYNPGSAKAADLAKVSEEDGIKCVEISRPGLDSLCRQVDRYKEHHVHQGIVADVTKLHYYPLDYTMPQIVVPPEPHLEKPNQNNRDFPPVWVLLCSVRDPGNLGSIIRSCYYLGVSRLIVTGARCQLSSIVSKCSSGTLEMVPVFAVKHPEKLVKDRIDDGWRVMAADIPDYYANVDEDDEEITKTKINTMNDISCLSVDDLDNSIKRPTLLVLGSEGAGIPPDLLTCVPERVFVQPSAGVDSSVDSLNVSVAAGIIIHKLCSSFRNT